MVKSPTKKASGGGPKRYPPWLQKAMRKKDEAEAFWRNEARRRSTRASVSPVGRKASSSEIPEAQPPRKENQHEQSNDANSKQASPESATDDAYMKRSITIWDAIERDNLAEVQGFFGQNPDWVFRRQERGSGGGAGVLHHAAYYNAVESLQWLIQHIEARGLPAETRCSLVNAIDTVNSQTTPLLAACRSSQGMMRQRVEVLRLLVNAGAEVDRQDAHGDNVLHLCARNSFLTLMRYLLKDTDAAASAVFAINHKRESPLDIAKRVMTKKPSFQSTGIFNLLRSLDRTCNIRLKMQVLKRHQTTHTAHRLAHEEEDVMTAIAKMTMALEQAESTWKHAMASAETHRQKNEDAHVAAAIQSARRDAAAWLESKDGKAFMKKRISDISEDIKMEIQQGKLAKPKDMKKAAQARAEESFFKTKEQEARKAATDGFRITHPVFPKDPSMAKLQEMLKM